MLTLIDNHLVPYWSAIDSYLIAEARKGLLVMPWKLMGTIAQHAHFLAEKTQKSKKKTNAFYDSCLRPRPGHE